MTLADLEADVLAWQRARDKAEERALSLISDDVFTLAWLHDHRADWDDDITTLGRRWLTRAIWHLEERVEAQLRAKP